MSAVLLLMGAGALQLSDERDFDARLCDGGVIGLVTVVDEEAVEEGSATFAGGLEAEEEIGPFLERALASEPVVSAVGVGSEGFLGFIPALTLFVVSSVAAMLKPVASAFSLLTFRFFSFTSMTTDRTDEHGNGEADSPFPSSVRGYLETLVLSLEEYECE